MLETMKAAIFDMDGTLLDSMTQWRRMNGAFVREMGIEPTEKQEADMMSMSGTMVVDYFRSEFGVDTDFEALCARACEAMEPVYSGGVPHKPGAAMLEINHCYAGRVGYTSGAEPALYLGEGDLSLHGLHTGVESVMQFPFDGYLGFSFRVDVARLDANLPDFMREAGVFGAQILARFCGENGFSVLSSAEQVGALLDPLYTLPERLLIPYAKLKFQELMLLLSVMDAPPVTQSAYQAEQIALIRRIHDQMMSDMSQRCTIEMLSQQYHINTSTLKSLFKTVYGQPLAAHMKEHRMEYAARLLRTTTDSLAEIAEKVGYESQSKLTTAFKSAYGVLPSEYRKEKKENSRP